MVGKKELGKPEMVTTDGPWEVRPDDEAGYPCWSVFHGPTNTLVAARINNHADAYFIAVARQALACLNCLVP